MLPMALIGALGKSATMLDRAKNLGKLSVVSGGYGGAYGFGSGEGGFENRMENAKGSAFVGVVAPSVLKWGRCRRQGRGGSPESDSKAYHQSFPRRRHGRQQRDR